MNIQIKNYPCYLINENGYVTNSKTGKCLKNSLGKNGYYYIRLSKNGKSKHHYIHRLIAEHFLPNPDNKPCIDHINTDRTDNRVENLRWVTAKENSNNTNTKNKVMSYSNYKSKPIIQFTKDGEFIRKWDCSMDIQRELGIEHSNISRCCKGKQKTCGGFIWRYYYKGIWMKNHMPMKDKMVG